MQAAPEKILRHYLRIDVEEEVARFCRGRWVAVECTPRGGRRIFQRYWDDRPLTISEPADLKRVLNKFWRLSPRTFYGSVNVYRILSSRNDLSRGENIAYSTPSWDIDGSLDELELIKEAAAILVEELRRHRVEKSIYLIWSGRGIHVHLNERAIGEEIWMRHGPIRVSFSIVEYILRSARERLMEVCGRSRDRGRPLKIENVMDVQRVFTAPLSLHRELDLVAVPINPDELDSFDLSWADMESFRYWRDWWRYVEGEADELALRALAEVRAESRSEVAASWEVEGEVEEPAAQRPSSIGRFQVMGLLQAARYYVLKGDLNLAKSFGLNRAIFYAWAKRRGASAGRPAAKRLGGVIERGEEEIEERVGDEVAYKSPIGWFSMGGQLQKPSDFDRQIAARFGRDFERYWRAAIEYVKSFPREVLESQREFYERIYLPVRDSPDKILRFAEDAASSS